MLNRQEPGGMLGQQARTHAHDSVEYFISGGCIAASFCCSSVCCLKIEHRRLRLEGSGSFCTLEKINSQFFVHTQFNTLYFQQNIASVESVGGEKEAIANINLDIKKVKVLYGSMWG